MILDEPDFILSPAQIRELMARTHWTPAEQLKVCSDLLKLRGLCEEAMGVDEENLRLSTRIAYLERELKQFNGVRPR